MNTSDHLPISVKLEVNAGVVRLHSESTHRVNWKKAKESRLLSHYESTVSSGMAPFSAKTYDSVAEIEDDIQRVSELLKDVAREHLPRLKFKKENRRWFDDQLWRICQ